MISKVKLLSAIFVGFVAVSAVLSKSTAQDSFKDKTLTFIIGYSPGGSFDLYVRVMRGTSTSICLVIRPGSSKR
jgi:tripartite-type tricarboxylate transporter receptor subunit TctC